MSATEMVVCIMIHTSGAEDIYPEKISYTCVTNTKIFWTEFASCHIIITVLLARMFCFTMMTTMIMLTTMFYRREVKNVHLCFKSSETEGLEIHNIKK